MKNERRIYELTKIRVLFDAGFDVYEIAELQTLSIALHHLAECYCNGDLTARQEKRQQRLMNRVNEICQGKTEYVQHHGDPRSGAGFVLFFGDKIGGRYAYNDGHGTGFYV